MQSPHSLVFSSQHRYPILGTPPRVQPRKYINYLIESPEHVNKQQSDDSNHFSTSMTLPRPALSGTWRHSHVLSFLNKELS
jgi:hypothetical protein